MHSKHQNTFKSDSLFTKTWKFALSMHTSQVRNILKILMFAIGKMKLVSFDLFLDAFSPRPKMPFGHIDLACVICYKIMSSLSLKL